MNEKKDLTIVGGALGECVHVAGVLNFLTLAEAEGYRVEFTGPATPPEEFIKTAQREGADILAVSYRLSPDNSRSLLRQLREMCSAAGLGDQRFVFGGTPPVVAVARELDWFEAAFSGEEPPEAIIAYLRGQTWSEMSAADYPAELIPRIHWKSPYPVLRHHFGLPGETIDTTVRGVERIAEAQVLDVVSLGVDQDAQENFFHPERQDARCKGAGGVPVRTADDFARLYAATRRGNYPLMRSYSGTDDLLDYAEVLRRMIRNAWCATSLFWFNAVDGRGPLSLRESIRDHIALMRWHGERDVPVEGNEPHHWELRDAHDAVPVAVAYIYAHVARANGVRDYIATYMFESPPHLSNRMDLAKQLAKIELAESLAAPGFRVWRQTRTGLMSYPVDSIAANAHLATSVYLQMALRPHIIHVVGSCEADHAATPEEVVKSCRMARRAIENALRGAPDMTADPEVQERKEHLKREARVIIEAIKRLGRIIHPTAPADSDPLLDVETLAQAVEAGLLDAPHLYNNPRACGKVRTRAVNGAIEAIDGAKQVLDEKTRVTRILEGLKNPLAVTAQTV